MKRICFLTSILINSLLSPNTSLAQQIDSSQLSGEWQGAKGTATLTLDGENVHFIGAHNWTGTFNSSENTFELSYTPSADELNENDTLPAWVVERMAGEVQWHMNLTVTSSGDILSLDGEFIADHVHYIKRIDTETNEIIDEQATIDRTKKPVKVHYEKSVGDTREKPGTANLNAVPEKYDEDDNAKKPTYDVNRELDLRKGMANLSEQEYNPEGEGQWIKGVRDDKQAAIERLLNSKQERWGGESDDIWSKLIGHVYDQIYGDPIKHEEDRIMRCDWQIAIYEGAYVHAVSIGLDQLTAHAYAQIKLDGWVDASTEQFEQTFGTHFTLLGQGIAGDPLGNLNKIIEQSELLLDEAITNVEKSRELAQDPDLVKQLIRERIDAASPIKNPEGIETLTAGEAKLLEGEAGMYPTGEDGALRLDGADLWASMKMKRRPENITGIQDVTAPKEAQIREVAAARYYSRNNNNTVLLGTASQDFLNEYRATNGILGNESCDVVVLVDNGGVTNVRLGEAKGLGDVPGGLHQLEKSADAIGANRITEYSIFIPDGQIGNPGLGVRGGILWNRDPATGELIAPRLINGKPVQVIRVY